MKTLKKILVQALVFMAFSCLLTVRLTAADNTEVYKQAEENNLYSYCEKSDGTLKIKAENSSRFSGKLQIPKSLDGMKVTEIAERGFIGQTDVTSLLLPETVTKIGEAAFSNCTSLGNVTVDGEITQMGLYPFFAAPYEEKLEKDGDFIIFAEDILYDYTGSSETISIPSGIRVISETLFTYFEASRDFKIRYVTIPDSVEYICNNAFYECNNIISVSLGTGIKSIGDGAFSAEDMTIVGFYETYAEEYAESLGAQFQPIVAYGEISDTIYVEFNDSFRQFYFTDETSFSKQGVEIFRRNYNGEKIPVENWDYSDTLSNIMP